MWILEAAFLVHTYTWWHESTMEIASLKLSINLGSKLISQDMFDYIT